MCGVVRRVEFHRSCIMAAFDDALAEMTDESISSGQRRATAESIGAMGADLTAVEVARVVDQLSNPHNCDVGGGAISIRRAALLALSALADGGADGTPKSVSACVPNISLLLCHEDADAREMALRAMAVMAAHADGAAIVPLLADEESDVRLAAVDALAVLRETIDAGVITRVVSLLKETDPADDENEARLCALRALGGIGKPAFPFAEVVVSCLADEAAPNRAAAATCLASVTMDEATAAHVDAIAALLEDDDASVRAAAVEALGALSAADSHGDAVSELLGDPDRSVRSAATAVLKRWGVA